MEMGISVLLVGGVVGLLLLGCIIVGAVLLLIGGKDDRPRREE
jgi:hypothetical protein